MLSGGRIQKAGWSLYLDLQGFVCVSRVATAQQIGGDHKRRMEARQISGGLGEMGRGWGWAFWLCMYCWLMEKHGSTQHQWLSTLNTTAFCKSCAYCISNLSCEGSLLNCLRVQSWKLGCKAPGHITFMVRNQKEKDECWCSAHFLLQSWTPVHRMVWWLN